MKKMKIFSEIDPRLQRIMAETSLRGGPLSRKTNVIAKVSDIKAWKALDKVETTSNLGRDSDGNWLVTARIPVTELENVRKKPFVITLKATQKFRPTLLNTTEDIKAREDLLPQDATGNQGRNVVIGIIDYGCDFMHKNFIENGQTRLISIWNQRDESVGNSPAGFNYGREYLRNEINNALQTNYPYLSLGYPSYEDCVSSSWESGSHGTHVMDIAAGNGSGTNNKGVAPEAELVFVHINHSPSISDPKTEEELTLNFGDSNFLLDAVRYIFDKAGDKPCVINISLGTNGGPHDGTNPVEEKIDSMVTEAPNRAVVIAASNSHEDGIHATGKVANGGYFDLYLIIPRYDPSANEVEIWYDKNDRFECQIKEWNGDNLGSVVLGENDVIDNSAGTKLFIAHRQNDPNNGDNVIYIWHPKNFSPSEIKLRLRLKGVNISDGTFHAWVERDNFGQSQIHPQDKSFTLSSIACGKESIVVGSYDAGEESNPLSYFSSSGCTRDQREKPEISAPGHDVSAAHSGTLDGERKMKGTSMAAPAVTGVVALMMAEARSRGKDLSIGQIRDILKTTARKDNPSAPWHPRYGHGRIDASAAVKAVQNL